MGERIIWIKVDSLDNANLKCEIYAKEYENEYTNEENQIVKVVLYEIIDIFAICDTGEENSVEVYAKLFGPPKEEISKMLDVMYLVEEEK